MKDNIETLFSKEQINHRVKELAYSIKKNMTSKEIVLIGLLKGSMMFIADLAREIDADVRIDFMIVSSYENESSSKNVQINKDLSEDINGKDVVIVEDIVDSGFTLDKIISILKTRDPKSLRVCALLDKIERREVPVEIDYVGFKVPNEFVVGYGMDYNQKYRNLPFVGIIRG